MHWPTLTDVGISKIMIVVIHRFQIIRGTYSLEIWKESQRSAEIGEKTAGCEPPLPIYSVLEVRIL